jgi:hypothetical protein
MTYPNQSRQGTIKGRRSIYHLIKTDARKGRYRLLSGVLAYAGELRRVAPGAFCFGSMVPLHNLASVSGGMVKGFLWVG